MNTNLKTRIAVLLVAVLMSVATNGAMLLKFDAVAQEGALASTSPRQSIGNFDLRDGFADLADVASSNKARDFPAIA